MPARNRSRAMRSPPPRTSTPWAFCSTNCSQGAARIGSPAGDLAASLLGVNPARPSQVATDELHAHARGDVTAKGLAAALRGDLDTIVLKAIQKEPQARYSTA